MDQTEVHLNISAVERETGLSKDVLRIWERRYGFPRPGRDGQYTFDGAPLWPPIRKPTTAATTTARKFTSDSLKGMSFSPSR